MTLLFDREYGEFCEYYCYYDSIENDWSEVEPPENADDDDFPYIEEEDSVLYGATESQSEQENEWEVIDG